MQVSMVFIKKTLSVCAFNFECRIDPADFTDRMSFLPSNFMEEISPNPEALNANT